MDFDVMKVIGIFAGLAILTVILLRASQFNQVAQAVGGLYNSVVSAGGGGIA